MAVLACIQQTDRRVTPNATEVLNIRTNQTFMQLQLSNRREVKYFRNLLRIPNSLKAFSSVFCMWGFNYKLENTETPRMLTSSWRSRTKPSKIISSQSRKFNSVKTIALRFLGADDVNRVLVVSDRD